MLYISAEPSLKEEGELMPLRSKCKNGHILRPYEAKGGTCDVCTGTCPKGTLVMDCRPCNYYVCTKCIYLPDSPVANVHLSISSITLNGMKGNLKLLKDLVSINPDLAGKMLITIVEVLEVTILNFSKMSY